MRPLEGSRLWRPFGKFLQGRKQPVPALPAWLSARSLHFIVNFVAIQVFSFNEYSLFAGAVIPETWTWVLSALWMQTPCCQNGRMQWIKFMGAAGMDWNTSVDYLPRSGKNTRNKLCKREKSCLRYLRWICFFHEYIYSMAFSGQPCVQCLRKGYCCGQHLFWPVDGIW